MRGRVLSAGQGVAGSAFCSTTWSCSGRMVAGVTFLRMRAAGGYNRRGTQGAEAAGAVLYHHRSGRRRTVRSQGRAGGLPECLISGVGRAATELMPLHVPGNGDDKFRVWMTCEGDGLSAVLATRRLPGPVRVTRISLAVPGWYPCHVCLYLCFIDSPSNHAYNIHTLTALL